MEETSWRKRSSVRSTGSVWLSPIRKTENQNSDYSESSTLVSYLTHCTVYYIITAISLDHPKTIPPPVKDMINYLSVLFVLLMTNLWYENVWKIFCWSAVRSTKWHRPAAAASKVKGGKSCLAQVLNICYQFPNQRVRFARPRARFHHRDRNVIVLNLILFIISFFKLQRSVPDHGLMVHT